MARLSIASTVAVLLALYTSPIVAQTPVKVSCPTITRTTAKPGCPLPTPFCATPDCILLKTVDVPCGCPTIIPTATLYTPCPKTCVGTCGTAYEANLLCSKTTTKTTQTTLQTSKTTISCPTITRSVGPFPAGIVCPDLACPYTADCIILSTVTGVCGCSGISTKYTCPTGCGGCATEYKTILPPCPYTSLPPTPTPV